MPNPPRPKVNWETAKECLVQLHRAAPALLQQAVIIGGVACWFYRHLLAKAADADFKVPSFSPGQEELWLSKDIDFTNFFAEDARQLLSDYLTKDAQDRVQLKVAGVPLGFAQVGLTFDPESAWAQSWIGNFPLGGDSVQFRVLDPVSLYREKLNLAQRRGLESDRMHCSVVAEFLRLKVCQEVQDLIAAQSLEPRTSSLKFLLSIRDRALEITQDERVGRRVRHLLERGRDLSPAERQLVIDLANAGSAL